MTNSKLAAENALLILFHFALITKAIVAATAVQSLMVPPAANAPFAAVAVACRPSSHRRRRTA